MEHTLKTEILVHKLIHEVNKETKQHMIPWCDNESDILMMNNGG